MGDRRCGRCGGLLEATELDGVQYEGCVGCHGLLVEQAKFVKLLGAFAEALGDYISMDGVIPEVPDSGVAVACPRCGRSMSRFGYMETRAVTLDRCGSCWVVWVDRDELQSAVILHARATHRAEARQTETIELADRLMKLKVRMRRGPT